MRLSIWMTVSLVAAGVFGLGAVGYASVYEWFNYNLVTNTTTPTTGWEMGDQIVVKWGIETQGGPYYENRTVYFATSTVGAPRPALDSVNWHEKTSCRQNSSVSSSFEDCYLTLATSTEVGNYYFDYYPGGVTLWIRTTMNYNGCGGFTIDPNIGGCGDANDQSITVTRDL